MDKEQAVIGYICPCCEGEWPGLPEIITNKTDITFRCYQCKEEWGNARDALQLCVLDYRTVANDR